MSFQPRGALISSHPAMPQTLCYLQPKPYSSHVRTSFNGVLNPVVASPRRWCAAYARRKSIGAETTGAEVDLQPVKTQLMKLTKGRLAKELSDRGYPDKGLKNDLADRLKKVLEEEEGSESDSGGSKDVLIGCSASFLLAKKKAELVELCTERGLPTGTKKVMSANLLEFLKGNSDPQAQDQGVLDTEVSQSPDGNTQKSNIDSSTTQEELLGMQMVDLRSFLTKNNLGPGRSKAIAVDKILKFYESGEEDGRITAEDISSEPVLDTTEAFSSEPKDPLPGKTALPLTLNKMESTVLELVDGMTMEGVRKFKKDELTRILKTSGIQLSGTKSNMMKELEVVYKRAKSIVENAELAESGQSLKEPDSQEGAQPGDKDKSTSMSNTTTDLRETIDTDRPSLVQNKALIGDEKAILEELLEEMHMKYGRYFKSSKQENPEMDAVADGFRVDDALDALNDLDSITDEDISKTVAWAESAPKELEGASIEEVEQVLKEKEWLRDADVQHSPGKKLFTGEQSAGGDILSSGRASRRRQKDNDELSIDNRMGEDLDLGVGEQKSSSYPDVVDDIEETLQEVDEPAPLNQEESSKSLGDQKYKVSEPVDAPSAIGTFDMVDAPLGAKSDVENWPSEDGPQVPGGPELGDSVDKPPTAFENTDSISQVLSPETGSSQENEPNTPVAIGSFDEETTLKDDLPTTADKIDGILGLDDETTSGVNEVKDKLELREELMGEEASGTEGSEPHLTLTENGDVILDSPIFDENPLDKENTENSIADVKPKELEESRTIESYKKQGGEDEVPQEDQPDAFPKGKSALEAYSSQEQASFEADNANTKALDQENVTEVVQSMSAMEVPVLESQDTQSAVEEDVMLTQAKSEDSLEIRAEADRTETSDLISEENESDHLTVEGIQQKVTEQKATLENIRSEIDKRKEAIASMQLRVDETSRKRSLDLEQMEQLLKATEEMKEQRSAWQDQMQGKIESIRADAERYDGKEDLKSQLESSVQELEQQLQVLEAQVQEKDKKADELRDSINSERKTEEREKVDSPEEEKLDGPKGASKSPVLAVAALGLSLVEAAKGLSNIFRNKRVESD